MRKSIDGLAAVVQEHFNMDPFEPALFLFCGRKANKIKGLLWEEDGYLLLTKRVEDGRFAWPRNSSEARRLSPKQFEWLMNGFSIDPVIKTSMPQKTA